ncbi:MAG TPA: winged helix DNA-binding domain-containing protein [Solirubrobacterales bacterium]|nr:winged helix DNA-binding domain-containing protein [Solirubrobacterales bacterium]
MVREAGPLQAQEPRAARLAFRARARALSAADVDRARTEERSLLRVWVMRKTVHLIPSEDAGWMVPLFAPITVRWSRKRLADFGLDRPGQDRALGVLHTAVADEGPLTRSELAERLEAAGFETASEFKVHLWLLATLDGALCLGPDRGGQTCLVLTRDWIGEPERRSREESLAELARVYVRAYAPASDRDLARWAGLPLRDARLGLERIAGELTEVEVGGESLLALGRAPRAARAPVVRMLGAYDNYNLGYESREFALDSAHVKRLVPGGGIVRPGIAVDGRFAGTWSSKRSGKRLAVSIEPFEELCPDVERALAAEVEDIGRFEGVIATLT